MKLKSIICLLTATAITFSIASCSGNESSGTTTAFDYEALISSIDEENANIQYDIYNEPAEYRTGEYDIGEIKWYYTNNAVSGGPASSSGNYSSTSQGFQNTYYSFWLNGAAILAKGTVKTEPSANFTSDEEYDIIINNNDFDYNFKGLAQYVSLSEQSE